MKKVRLLCIFFICMLFMIFSCACWDRVEIDRKGFVSVIGIDAGKDMGKDFKDVKPTEPFVGETIKRLKVTFGYLDVGKMVPEGSNGSGNAEEAVLTSEGYSMEDAVNNTYKMSSRSVHFGHARLLLLNSELFTYPEVVKEIADYLQRQPQLDKEMFVLITDGSTENFIKYKPFMEKNIEDYIYGLMANSRRNATILPVTLNEFLELISENGNAILPNLGFTDDKSNIKLTGTSLIKNYEIKGRLNPYQTSDAEILRGKIEGGKKAIFVKGHPVEFLIDKVQRRISVYEDGVKLNFNINIDIEGELNEYPINGSAFLSKNINMLEKDFNESLQSECEKVIFLTQKEYDVDPFGINDFLRKYHPHIWKNVKDDWGKAYGSSKINVSIETRIRRIGVAE